MKRANAESYLLKSIEMRKCQYFGHKRKCRRTKEDGKIEEILDRRDARTDEDGPGGAKWKRASMAKYDRRHPLRGDDWQVTGAIHAYIYITKYSNIIIYNKLLLFTINHSCM